LVLAAVTGLLAGPAPVRAGAEPAPLPWRVGGRVGFTVDAAAFPESAGTTLDVYVRVPTSTLATLERDDKGAARIRVRARLRGAYGGGRPAEQIQEFAIDPADSSAGFGRVVGLRFPARPGRLRLLVRVEDALSHRRGLAYTGREVRESGQIEGELRIPPAEGGRELSDIEFVWASQPGGPPSTFLRGGRTLLPDPERLYGLLANSMRAAFSARSLEERPWHWATRVLDAQGQVVAEHESTGVAARELGTEVTTDLSMEPAGGYGLELRVWQEGDAAPLVRRARFSIAWQLDSWRRAPTDVQDDAHFLLSPDDEDAFALLSPGEQERELDDFWSERDPTPGTGLNEARVTFLQRVETANRLYTRPGLGKGMFSDMGRVFIRHGEPSEIVNQVIPSGDQTLDQIIAELVSSQDRAVGDINSKSPGGDLRAFELWIYEGPIGLPPDADPRAAGHPRLKRLLFLFVDDRGTGDFRLRYSTE
jgi:GWxTD domain-containing protein